jgi:ribonuclease HI
VSKLGRKTPTRASELMDIATKFASGQEAVEAIFRKDKQPQGRQPEDVPEASTQRGTKKKGMHCPSRGRSTSSVRYCPRPRSATPKFRSCCTRRKLRHYFESHPVTVVSSFPLGEIIQCQEASDRIAKWAVEIMGETISFAPRKAIKSQVLADFVAKWVDTQLLAALIQPELWTMFFDGSLMKTGAGAGLLFISPLRKHLRYVLRHHFPASNNVAEYEALVNGLRIAIELGVQRLDARGDSQLVINQVMKNSHCRDPKMEAYCDEVRRLEDKFYGLEINHVARRYNETADELAKIASGRTTVPQTSSPETYINPQSRPMTRPSPRRPQPCLRHPRLSPRRPRLSPRHPRPPRVRHCALRKSGAGSCLIETGRPRTCNISTEESCPSTEPKLGDWRDAPSRSSCWGTGRSSTTAAPQASSPGALTRNTLGGLRSSRSASSPCWKCFPTRFLLADRGGRHH